MLGPNGAGKSTTFNMITGLLHPDSGSIFLGEKNINSVSDYKYRIGVVPQDICLYENFTILENLRFLGRLYGMRGSKLRTTVDELIEAVQLTEKRNVEISKLSGGMKRRINIAAALVHDPGFSQTTCGMTAMFILFLCVLWGSLSILEERLTGTLTRLRVSPASFVTIFGSKLVCTGLLAFLQFVLFFTIGHFALNVPVGNVYLLKLTNIIYILQAAAMGLLISIFARSRLSAMGLSFLVIMMLSPLGGLWFPLEIVPVTLQKIAAFLPTGSFMIAMDKIINKDAVITTILPQLAVMSLYFAITFVLSIKSGWIKKFRMA